MGYFHPIFCDLEKLSLNTAVEKGEIIELVYNYLFIVVVNKYKPSSILSINLKNILILLQSTSVLGRSCTQNLFHIAREKRPT